MPLPRTLLLTLVSLFTFIAGYSQTQRIAGRWDGGISIAGTELGISVMFLEAGDSLSATIDIPVQNAMGLPLTGIQWRAPRIHFELPAGQGLAVFDGQSAGDSIAGTFKQSGFAGTFHLNRAPAQQPVEKRGEPLPYREEEVIVQSGALRLAGTLTLPRGSDRYPAVVMITGSGAQNRDEELFGFRPFRIIADHLTRKGIAVLRCDDRGVGGSTGSVSASTTADFADDALAEVQFLKSRPDIDVARIGLCGHSEGASVAPLAASRSNDVAFIVLLAPPAVPGDTITLSQIQSLAHERGATEEEVGRDLRRQRRLFDAVRFDTGWGELIGELRAQAEKGIHEMTREQRAAVVDTARVVQSIIDAQLAGLKSPWFRYFLDYDPAPTLEKVHCPVLAMFGERDKQVTVALNRGPLEAALKRGGNRDAAIEIIPGANHLFITAVTGSPLEYTGLKKEFVPGFLDSLSTWMLNHVRAGE